MKPIVIISPLIPPYYSGAGSRAYRHASFLAKEKLIYCLIVACRVKPRTEGTSEPKIKSIKQPLSFTFKLWEYIYFNVISFFWFYKNRRNFDIIHSFDNSWYVLGALFFARLFKKKVIVEFTLLPDNKTDRTTSVTKRIRDFVMNHATTVVCISQRLKEWCVSNGINNQNIWVIPNDTPLKKDNTPNQELREKYGKFKKIILCVGAQIHRKGIDVAIDTLKLLNEKHNDIALLWVGLLNNEIYYKGQKRLMQDVVPSNFFSIPATEKIQDYYCLADITLFPSRREGFGNVIIESMASGTPVVASLLKGISDTIIDNTIDGLLVEGDNPEAYAKEIERLLHDSQLHRSIQANGLRKVKKEFSSDVIMKKYISLYRNERVND